MNLRSIDLNLLVIFDALMAEKSITRAARKVGITPSAMSHALRRLRDTFNDELIERTGRGMVPTRRATELWTSVREALQQLQHAIGEQLEFDPKTSKRSFTVRIPDYLVQCAVPRLCARVRADAPNTTLVVDYLRGEGPGSDNPGDIQLRVCADDWGPDYRQQRVLLNRFLVAMRPDHPAAGKEMTRDLYLSLEHLTTSSVGARMIDDRLIRQGLSRRIALTIPSLAAVIPVLEHSDLCTLLPEQWIKHYCAPGRLATANPPFADSEFTLDMIWRKQDEGDAGHQWLRRLIVEEMILLLGASEWFADGSPHRLERVPVRSVKLNSVHSDMKTMK
jgi:DNA-binding transcriptional LysR family regulator